MTMTNDELKAKYITAYRIVRRERKKREWVFRNDPAALAQKLGEMDELLGILTAFKDELKEHMGEEYEQPALLDVPKKATYN